MPLDREERIEAFARVPLFARCSRADLGRIAAIAGERELPAGGAVTREGQRARELIVVLGGTADVRRETRLLPPLGPGDVLGELGLVSDLAPATNVTAITPLHVLVVEARAFRALLRERPQIQARILEVVSDRLAVA